MNYCQISRCFNPSSLESYLESQASRASGISGSAFQSFFSGKLFGKSAYRAATHRSTRVSILLLWKVIWKDLTSKGRFGRSRSFNPSSLESYLERLLALITPHCPQRVSILLLWKVIWKDRLIPRYYMDKKGFNPSSLESYLESRQVGHQVRCAITSFNPSSLESYLESLSGCGVVE